MNYPKGQQHRLTEQDIVDRADDSARIHKDRLYISVWCALALFVLAGFAFLLFPPVLVLLRLHREFLWGVLAGSVLQSVGWLRDRWRWMKWFSHQ